MERLSDSFDLERFVTAQAGSYADALTELKAGRKRSHWMWFIFPQLAGLGQSETARFFGLRSTDEAKAYLGHQLLGPRLRECCVALLAQSETRAETILGNTDSLKLRSSMTLFEAVADDRRPFDEVLVAFYDGRRDPLTLDLLRSG